MVIRRPQEHIAGCCWLPRYADKVRLCLVGQLPFLYRVALNSSLGMDGYFLRHFKLSRREVVRAIARAKDDGALARWFLERPGVTQQRIADWNTLAPRLGATGQPGFMTRHLVKWVLYPRSTKRPVNSLFEAIEQDEKTGAFAEHKE